jgi:hypothetical protein
MRVYLCTAAIFVAAFGLGQAIRGLVSGKVTTQRLIVGGVIAGIAATLLIAAQFA